MAYKWLARFRDEGPAGLEDRSSRPHRIWSTPAAWVRTIEHLRRLRMTSTHIASRLHLAHSTVSAVLVRLGLNGLWRLEPPEPPNRYCRRHPGELIHVDVKKLGRFHRPGHRVGGSRARSHRPPSRGLGGRPRCVDDTTRVAYVEILPDERAKPPPASWNEPWLGSPSTTCTSSGSSRTTAHPSCRRPGLSGVGSTRSVIFAPALTGPARMGKQQRFIQTMRREWAYVASYPDSAAWGRALQPWVRRYNCERPHGSLGKRTPMGQLALLNNLAGNHS